jgi:hypothetical protein
MALNEYDAGIAQLVEHNLAKVGVAGSNPVSRSISPLSERELTGSMQCPEEKILFRFHFLAVYFFTSHCLFL